MSSKTVLIVIYWATHILLWFMTFSLSITPLILGGEKESHRGGESVSGYLAPRGAEDEDQ